jgi:multimeric flavodoxin WrbA/putative sterol carrier protein
MEDEMNVLALNSSPRAQGQSKTELMLDALAKGMRKAGAEVEIVALRKKNVRNCIGCFTCWTKTPGVCVQKDDMTKELFPKWVEADLAVYATPIYHWTMNAAMKAFVERTLPVVEPFFVMQDGRWKHPLRRKPPQQVVLAVAAFPEDVVFSQLSSYLNFLLGKGLVAEIYRPASEMMILSPYKDKLDDILAATEQAGAELVKDMKIAPETMARIKQPVGDFQTFAEIGNVMWKTCIAEGVTPKQMEKRGIIPRPDSIETFITIMRMAFNPEAATDIRMILQFSFSGEVEGSCYFTVAEGSCEANLGIVEKPDLAIAASFEVWMDIMTGKVDSQQMFVEQKCRAEGDMSLLMRMNQVFGG